MKKSKWFKILLFVIAFCISAIAIAWAVLNSNNKSIQQKTKFRGVMSPKEFCEKDFKTLAEEWNVNLIRWQLNLNYKIKENDTSVKSLDNYDELLNNKLLDLDSALNASKKYGIKLIIDLHTPPGGRTENKQTALFYNEKLNNHFIETWKAIAERYKNHPALWAYDLINEPVQIETPPKGLDYYTTQIKAIEAIRKIDSITPIIFEVLHWDGAKGFELLSPLPYPNIIYSVHMYYPYEFTHQGIQNDFQNAYPGMITKKYINKQALKNYLYPVRNFQITNNVPIFVGEFSAIRWASGASQYLKDCIDIFEEYGWNWTYHAFREYNGWDVEYQNGTDKNSNAIKSKKDTDRKKVLLKAFAKNNLN